MSEPIRPENTDKDTLEAQKRVQKIKKFYKELASWAGTSVILLGLNLFLSGGISWSKFPVVIWGIIVLAQAFDVIRLQRLDKQWEERQLKRFTGTPKSLLHEDTSTGHPAEPLEDYSEELLNRQDREIADLSEYRKLKRPWKDEDLV